MIFVYVYDCRIYRKYKTERYEGRHFVYYIVKVLCTVGEKLKCINICVAILHFKLFFVSFYEKSIETCMIIKQAYKNLGQD